MPQFGPAKSIFIYNLGNSSPNHLIELVSAIEVAYGKKTVIIIKPKQKGDVFETYADVTKAKNDYGFNPTMPLEKGIQIFVDWYKVIILHNYNLNNNCLLYTSPSPRDATLSRMPSSA